MLTVYQNEKVSIAAKLLTDVKNELGDETENAEALQDAVSACKEVLDRDLPPGYTPPKKEWYSPDAIKESLPTPTTGDRILGMLSRVVGVSVVCAGLSACLSLGCWGVSEFKAASHDYHQPDFAAQSKGYLGPTAIFGSLAGTSLVLAAIVGREVD